MSVTWPSHQLTLAEWDALPEAEGVRLELVEGLIVMAAVPVPWHQRAGTRLCSGLDEQLPRALVSLTAVEVVVSDPPPTVRVPDVVVTHTMDRRPGHTDDAAGLYPGRRRLPALRRAHRPPRDPGRRAPGDRRSRRAGPEVMP